ncbi:MAG: transcription-repair coupling factor [Lautropia sp.]
MTQTPPPAAPSRAAHHDRLPPAHGSSDAWTLAPRILEHAKTARRDGGRPVHAIVCAQAHDAARLAQELAWFAPELAIAVLPDWEILPYDHLSPHQDLVSERLAALNALQRRSIDVLVVAASTALHRLAPAAYIAARTFEFHKGQRLDEKALRAQLTLAGYTFVSQVVGPGEYCVRGGLIDLFPMGSALPYRIDLFGDEIESLRTFDPDSQRSVYPVDRVHLLPGREFPLDEAARASFRGRWRERFDGDPSRATVYRDVGNGIASNGIEYYLPLFHESTATLFDYLPEGSRLVLHGDIDGQLRAFREDAQQRYRFLGADPERPALTPDELFLDAESFFAHARRFDRISVNATRAGEDRGSGRAPASSDGAATPRRQIAVAVPAVAINRRHADPLDALRSVLDAARIGGTMRCAIVTETAGRQQTLSELFGEHGLTLPSFQDWASFVASDAPAMLGVGPVHAGFQVPGELLVLTEAELFPGFARTARRRGQATQVDNLIRDLSELKPGDAVVHSQHGIGRYQGLVNLDLGEGTTEFLHLVYANDAALYVPVAQLHLIGRYTGAAAEAAPLHVLGSGQWEKARRKAAARARDTAAELLELYAKRAARPGHAFVFKASDYEAFAESFGFEETADQLAAIHAVVQDLVSTRPMDRLVCGDVGFGKTEVALRAAFVAAAGGRQVAVLTPTTLLAEQHFQTFSDRFASWPIRIAELSRFKSAKESRAIVDELAKGKVDIVIGTHKLLSKDVSFKDLGLVIIDEEHRFGVRQKEALKALRAEVDILTLTATPIPRTLAMSLEGIRDFSVIATAPQKRLSIKTFVRAETAGTIREALLRELKRGGQVYFLHNEVQTIENRRRELETLVPEARIRVAHGQMPERELESVMRDFHQQRFNVLLCTTIIETGIDIPTANTIVMHRADRFGLAQLHQLRGRVGRSHHQAYAYLLTPGEDALTKDAQRRLDAIQSMEDLGAGFYLSMHDLEIRGAGEVLGDSQSGAMQEVGFDLYSSMLQTTVKALKLGVEPDLSAPEGRMPEINLHAPALLPQDYCGDVHERLILYKRLASCSTQDELTLLREELVDRFGKLPEPARLLVDTHRLRLLAQAIGLVKVDATPEQVSLQFSSHPLTGAETILRFAQSRKDTSFGGQDRLRVRMAEADPLVRANKVRDMLMLLQPADSSPSAIAPEVAGGRHPAGGPTAAAGGAGGTPAGAALSRKARRAAERMRAASSTEPSR